MTVITEIYGGFKCIISFFKMNVIGRKKLMLKCLKCPYKLGLVKCIKSPCPECKASKSKRPPFPEAEIKEEKTCKSIKH